MVVTPPPMRDDIKEWKGIFKGAPAKSRELALHFEIIADSLEVHFFDAGTIVETDPIDGFHLSQAAHEGLGIGLAREVEAIGWT
jgi:lysophospholipase L1-like esterase